MGNRLREGKRLTQGHTAKKYQGDKITKVCLPKSPCAVHCPSWPLRWRGWRIRAPTSLELATFVGHPSTYQKLLLMEAHS